jgi:hypothetical protein
MIDAIKIIIHFVSDVSITFVEWASIFFEKKYLKRRSVDEDLNDTDHGSLSAGMLWGVNNDCQENLKNYMK